MTTQSNPPAVAVIPWRVYRAELIGTALLVLVGLSVVILMFGDGSPIPGVLASEGWRLLITGFLFGTTIAMLAREGFKEETRKEPGQIHVEKYWQ